MNLQEWEIWHTYSTYLECRVTDLDAAGYSLVQSGIALCAMHRDGRTHWRSETGIQSGQTTIHPDYHGNEAKIEIDPDDGKEPSFISFAQEAWFQAAHFRFNEIRLFGADGPLPPPYVRLFLGLCKLTHSKENVVIGCYPVLKLHESGVVILELRIIGPEGTISTKDFIQNYVELPLQWFNRVEVPPAISTLGTRAYYHGLRHWPFYLRARLLSLERKHDLAVEQRTVVEQSGDFAFSLAPLSREEGFHDTLSSFSQSVFGLVGFVLSHPRKGVSFLLRGQKQLNEVGKFWIGRPHMYLVRFDNQGETASRNEELHRKEFGRIMAKQWSDDRKLSFEYLPENSRRFEDYGAYISLQATLWVWSKRGL